MPPLSYNQMKIARSGAPAVDGMTNLLITRPELGQDLAATLGDRAVVLMRGHGATIVGSSVKEAVFRAVYTMINAQLQPKA
ncbi:MAG: class II aldolase/adducin family protein [Solimonas sp.]